MNHSDTSFEVSFLAGTAFLLLLGFLFLLVFGGKRLRQWKQLAQTDPVSGGLNGNGLSRAAEKYLSGSNLQYAVIMMELCNYRQITQTFGRTQANQVLKYLYGVLKTDLSNTEPSASLGAGRFCFLLKNRQETAIRARLTRIQENANRFNRSAQVPYHLELRFGVYIPTEKRESLTEIQEKTAALLENTDEQMCFYQKERAPSKSRNWELIQQMDHSLANGDFQPYLQPMVRLSDNRIVGAQAQLRWRHPEQGLLTSEMFLPLLEEYHLVSRYELSLFEQVCLHMQRWIKAGKDPCPISVRLSRESIRKQDFLRPYVQIATKYSIPHALIEFSLDKTLQQEDIQQIKHAVEGIHAHKFRCALDHFGGSEIPLHLLRGLDLDALRLDPSLFASENNNRRNRFVVEAILKIASQMHIHTVATGIDNASQVQYLKQAGCDMVQGFHYFQPLPIEEFSNAVYRSGELRYVEEDANRGSLPEAKQNTSSNFVMFSLLAESDRIVFSRLFSPVLEGQLTHSGALSLLHYSELIHENDRKDFFHLLERCQKESGWVENAIRFYTARGRYEWLEVHLHKEYIPAVGETVVSGTLVNMAGWKSEVNRWKEKANRDALTGLYNREYFEQFASSAIEKNQLTTAAIIFVDIDDFKLVNDTLGHTVGDDVICWFAKRVLGTFRHTDIVARYGGDEFVVFVNGIGREELSRRLQQLCEGFRFPYRNGNIEYPASGSIGAAMFPEDGTTYLEMLNHADSALYEAKHRGKNQFVLYYPELGNSARQ